MPEVADTPQLEALLQHPSLWRGRGAAAARKFHHRLRRARPGAAGRRLAATRPGRNPRAGHAALASWRLWAPLVTRLTQSETARWCAFIAPPFEPFVPAWSAQGARLDRLLVVRASATAVGTGTEPAVRCLRDHVCLAAARHHAAAAPPVAGHRARRIAGRAVPATARRRGAHHRRAAHGADAHGHAAAHRICSRAAASRRG